MSLDFTVNVSEIVIGTAVTVIGGALVAMFSRYIKKSDARHDKIDAEFDDAKDERQRVAERLAKSDEQSKNNGLLLVDIQNSIKDLWEANTKALDEINNHAKDDSVIHREFAANVGEIKGLLQNQLLKGNTQNNLSL